jgi:hypothetical protein
VAGKHIAFRRLEHAVEAPQHDERQNHTPVLGLLVDAAQLVRHRPDEGGVVSQLMVGAHAGKA